MYGPKTCCGYTVKPLTNPDTLGSLGTNETLVRCPDFRVVINTDGVFRMAKCVLFIEVSSFQGVLIRDVSP